VLALSGVFLIVLVIAGFWATKAINLTDVDQAIQNDTVATSLAPGMSVAKLTEGATAIFIGKCVGIKSVWIGRNLVTLATISVGEPLKGPAAAGMEVTVELLGGVDMNRRIPVAVTYADEPHIYLNEEVFLFVTGPDDGSINYSVMGLHGKFSISKANDGEEVVTPEMTRAPLQKGAGVMRGNPRGIRLSEFKASVIENLN
jgi:hypothetical protein